MRCRLFSISILIIFAMSLSGCAAPTAVSPTTVLPTAAPSVVIATTVPTAVPTTVPPTVARTAVVATTIPTAVPPTPAPTARPTQAQSTSSSSGSTKLDMNVLVPPGDGRDLIMENCMACHSIAPLVTSQKTAGEWQGTMINHRGNMGGVSDADYKKMTDYLSKNYGPDHKIPDLPPELLSGWTNY
jgi:hypothetical protein